MTDGGGRLVVENLRLRQEIMEVILRILTGWFT